MAALLEMPADSKEFLLVEKGLLKVEGLVDDSWDEKDPVQSGYLFAKFEAIQFGPRQSHLFHGGEFP